MNKRLEFCITPPIKPKESDMYYNPETKELFLYIFSNWMNMGI